MCPHTALFSLGDRVIKDSRPLAAQFSPDVESGDPRYYKSSKNKNENKGKYSYTSTFNDASRSKGPQPMVCPCTALLGLPIVLAVPVAGSRSPDVRPTIPPGTLVSDLLMMDPDTGYLAKSLP